MHVQQDLTYMTYWYMYSLPYYTIIQLEPFTKSHAGMCLYGKRCWELLLSQRELGAIFILKRYSALALLHQTLGCPYA